MGLTIRRFSLMILFLLISSFVYGEVDLDRDYTSWEYYEIALEMEKEYPSLIDVEIIGYSTDNRPIYVIRLTEDNDEHKMHYLVEGGLHSRENAATPIIMKTIEMYLKDYDNQDTITAVSVRDYLENNVIHFIPVSSPDGYDFANYGIGTLSSESKSKIRSLWSNDYSNYKSNVNGVDLNRNFPGEYYNIWYEKWYNIWNVNQNEFISNRPSSMFYHGPYEGSEKETQALMTYMLRYDFRNHLSYHSRGQELYWYKWMLSDKHNKYSESLSSLISMQTGYESVKGDKYGSSSGYSTDYFSMQTLKPSITIETVSSYYSLPTSNYVIKREYEKMLLVPLIAVTEGKRVGYFDYKWYRDNQYIRDFNELEYAVAMKEKHGGIIIKREGIPEPVLTDDLLPVTRLQFVDLVVDYFETPALDDRNFLDTGALSARKARALGFVSGFNGYFRPYDYVTYSEVLVVLRKAFYGDDFIESNIKSFNIESWAHESAMILLNHEIIDYSHIKPGNISLGEIELLIERITGGTYDRVE